MPVCYQKRSPFAAHFEVLAFGLQNPRKSLSYIIYLKTKSKMKNHCVVVNFSLRESKANKKGLSPIEASISYNGERIYFSTGKLAKVSKWNKQKQQVRGNSQESLLINNFLIELRNKIYEKEIELMKRGYMVTVCLLKDAVFNKVEALKDKTLMQVISQHNDYRRNS